MTVVGPPVSVLAGGAPKLGHGKDHNVSHAIAHILVERSQRIAELFEAPG
jgi:hypothetical protein